MHGCMLGVGNIKMDLLRYVHVYMATSEQRGGENRILIITQLLLKCYRLFSLATHVCVHVDM